MSAPPPDLARVTVLADELAELGRRLDGARAELLSWLPAPAPPPTPTVPAPQPAREQPRPTRERPRPRSGLTSGRVLAWTGGAVTLIGIVLFLALAASRGWFGPSARLAAGALFGLVLVGLGRWLHRRPDGRVGAVALVATGVAALYLDVGTATAKYQLLSEPVGIAAGLAVVAGGLTIADRWDSRQLAAGVLVGGGLLMPALTGGGLALLVALVLVLQVGVAPAVLRRGWTAVAALAAAFPVGYAAFAVLGTLWSVADRPETTAAVLAVYGIGVVLAALGADRLPVPAGAGLLVAAPVPALSMAMVLEGLRGACVAGLVGLGLLMAATVRRLPAPMRVGAAAAGGVAVFEATALALGGAALTALLLGQALVLAVVSAATRRCGPLFAAAGYGVVGVGLAALRDAPVWALATFPSRPYVVAGRGDETALLTGLALSVLVLALVLGVLTAAARLGAVRGSGLWVPVGAVGLYAAAGCVLTGTLLVSATASGFVVGHAIITVSWTVVALGLLARGVTSTTPRVVGLVLVAAAVAKLVLFDLVSLDGLARVAAFLGAGLVLLAAGSRYARAIARTGSQDSGGAERC